MYEQMDSNSGQTMPPLVDVLFSLPLREMHYLRGGVLPKLHHPECLFLLREAEEQEGEKEAIVMAESW